MSNIEEKMIKDRLKELNAARRNACFAAEDGYWSPDDKQKHIDQIDKEIELTEEYLNEVLNKK